MSFRPLSGFYKNMVFCILPFTHLVSSKLFSVVDPITCSTVVSIVVAIVAITASIDVILISSEGIAPTLVEVLLSVACVSSTVYGIMVVSVVVTIGRSIMVMR